MTVVSPSCHLCFLPTSYREEVPTSPFLEFDKFARAAHETQRNISLTRLPSWFITKGHNWGTAAWKRCTARICRKSMELPCPLPVGHSHQICLPTQKLSFWGFVDASLHRQAWLTKSLAVGNWSLSPASLPSLEVVEWDWMFPPSNHMVGFTANQPPSLGGFQKSPHGWQK